jgi:hypothetical protein
MVEAACMSSVSKRLFVIKLMNCNSWEENAFDEQVPAS